MKEILWRNPSELMNLGQVVEERLINHLEDF
jgi:hypothetical protein